MARNCKRIIFRHGIREYKRPPERMLHWCLSLLLFLSLLYLSLLLLQLIRINEGRNVLGATTCFERKRSSAITLKGALSKVCEQTSAGAQWAQSQRRRKPSDLSQSPPSHLHSLFSGSVLSALPHFTLLSTSFSSAAPLNLVHSSLDGRLSGAPLPTSSSSH